MPAESPLDPTFFGFLIGFVLVGIFLGAIVVLWERLSMAVLALVAQLSARLVPVTTKSKTRKPVAGKRDAGFIAFTKLLGSVCRVLPGDASRHPYTFILPVTLIGIPVFILGFGLFWAGALLFSSYVLSLGSSGWITAAAFLSVFVYIGVVGTALKLLVRIPGKVRRQRAAWL